MLNEAFQGIYFLRYGIFQKLAQSYLVLTQFIIFLQCTLDYE
jgi:hypothetical protein